MSVTRKQKENTRQKLLTIPNNNKRRAKYKHTHAHTHTPYNQSITTTTTTRTGDNKRTYNKHTATKTRAQRQKQRERDQPENQYKYQFIGSQQRLFKLNKGAAAAAAAEIRNRSEIIQVFLANYTAYKWQPTWIPLVSTERKEERASAATASRQTVPECYQEFSTIKYGSLPGSHWPILREREARNSFQTKKYLRIYQNVACFGPHRHLLIRSVAFPHKSKKSSLNSSKKFRKTSHKMHVLDLDPTGTYRRPRETRETRHKQRQLALDPTGQY